MSQTQPIDKRVAKYEFSEDGLVIRGQLNFEEWLALGHTINHVRRNLIPRAIGRWLLYGERRYGEKYAQGMELFNLDYATLANYVSTVRAFDESSRWRENLSFSHHAAVAVLPAEVADDILDRAEREGMNRAEVREAAREWVMAQGATVPDRPSKQIIIPPDPGPEPLAMVDTTGRDWQRDLGVALAGIGAGDRLRIVVMPGGAQGNGDRAQGGYLWAPPSVNPDEVPDWLRL